MDTGVIQFYYALWDKVFLYPLQLGLFSAIFGDNGLFIKFMSEVTVFIKVQGTPAGKDERCSISDTFKSCH